MPRYREPRDVTLPKVLAMPATHRGEGFELPSGETPRRAHHEAPPRSCCADATPTEVEA